MRSRLGRRLSSETLRSWSQKNLASHSRARSTRSLPATIAAPPSLACDVGDEDEAARQRAVGRAQRQVFLVGAHGGDQRLGRHGHEGLVDGGHERHRPLDQALELVEQARIVGDREALPCGQLLRAARR